jgi:hypothetical protein
MPLPLGALAGGIEAGAGALQAGIGLLGMRGKKRAAQNAFNAIETYTESPYVKANLQAAQQGLNAPMAGEQEAKMNINQAAVQGLNAAKTRKGGLQAIGMLNDQQQKALQGLGVQKAQFRLGAQAKLAQANQAMAQEAAKAFQSRQEKQAMQYQQNLSELLAQKQMISQGLSGIGQGAANAIGAGAFSGLGRFGGMKADPQVSQYMDWRKMGGNESIDFPS